MIFIYNTGCVEVVGCLEHEELAGWEMVPEGVRYHFFPFIFELFSMTYREYIVFQYC